MLFDILSFCTEPFATPNDETVFTYPIGALIDLRLLHTFTPMTDEGGVTIDYSLVPRSHTPLQQADLNIYIGSDGITAGIRYDHASPSLTGEYVLCNANEIPRLCGGRLSLIITGT